MSRAKPSDTSLFGFELGVFDPPEAELPLQCPRACERVRSWPSLAARLWDIGMLQLLPAASTPSVGGERAAAAIRRAQEGLHPPPGHPRPAPSE